MRPCAQAAPLPVRSDSQGEVWVWDLEDLRPIAKHKLHPVAAGILHLRLFHSGGAYLLATQGRDGVTHIWQCSPEGEISG